jgi:hypothetical protein
MSSIGEQFDTAKKNQAKVDVAMAVVRSILNDFF